MNPQFLRQRHNVVAALEPLHRHPTELLRMPSRSFLGHLQSPFPAKCASSVCLKIGVHSTKGCATNFSAHFTADSFSRTQSADEGDLWAAAFLACRDCRGCTSNECSISARIPRAAAFAAERVVMQGIL